MNIKIFTWFTACLLAMLAGLTVQAAPPTLPPTAIGEDTYFVVTMDLAKLDPPTLEASAKAALGDKAGEMDDLLASFKSYHQKLADKGAVRLNLILSGDPEKQNEPPSIFYMQFKAGADHDAVEKLIRAEEGENNPEALEITNDGDFMVLRKKGLEPPTAGSEERAKLFAEALGDCDKPVVAAVIFNAPMLASIQKGAQRGVPPAFVSIVTDSKWIRGEVTLGEKVKADVTIATADEETAKRLAEAVTDLGGVLKAEAIATRLGAKQQGPQAAQLSAMSDAMTATAEAMTGQAAGSKVNISADGKTVGQMTRGWMALQKLEGQSVSGNKAGV